MATDEKLSTVQIDQETKEKLRELANADKRSMAGQLSWLIHREWKKKVSSEPVSPSDKQSNQ